MSYKPLSTAGNMWLHTSGASVQDKKKWEMVYRTSEWVKGEMMDKMHQALKNLWMFSKVSKYEHKQMPQEPLVVFSVPSPAEERRDRFGEHLMSSHGQSITWSCFLHWWHGYCLSRLPKIAKKPSAKYWVIFKHIYNKH